MNAIFLEKLWKNMFLLLSSFFLKEERRRNYLVSEPNFHTIKFFAEKLLAIEMKKTEIHCIHKNR